LADSIKEACNLTTEYIEGSGGVFDVFMDDKLIFSKNKEFRFPESHEIVNLIKNNL